MTIAYEIKRALYEALPTSFKRSVCLLPFTLLAGKTYRTTFQRGDWFDLANRDMVLRYQERALRDILQFAVDQIPAYSLLRSTVERHKPFDAIQAFPFLDKDMLKARLNDFLPRSFEKIPHYETTTGGTSGNQLSIFLDNDSQSVEMGFMHRQWRRVGYTPSHRKATFRGVFFTNLKPGTFWQHNPIYNEIQFSPFHMSETNLERYIEQIIHFAPEYLHGYPSAIEVLAEYVLRLGLMDKLPKIKAVLLGSEGTTQGQRMRIERAFHARVYSWYGHSERVVLGGECEKNSSYHHFPDYGILEIIDDAGRSCESEGTRGEIIGTGLINRCMPLIRYRTGDYAVRLESRCECGRNWDRFANVEGRWNQEMVIGRNGSKISVASLNMHGSFFERVIRYQYYQESPGRCILRVVVAPDFNEKDSLEIQKAYENKLGGELEIKLEVVEDIPLTNRGKLKLLDTKLC